MELTEHLEELRYRLLHIVAIITISFAICYTLGGSISEILLTTPEEGPDFRYFRRNCLFRGTRQSHLPDSDCFLGIPDCLIPPLVLPNLEVCQTRALSI